MGVYGKSKPNPRTVSRMMVDEHPLRPNDKTAAENRRARKANKRKPDGVEAKPSPSGTRVGSPWSWENVGIWIENDVKRMVAEALELPAVKAALEAAKNDGKKA